MANALQILASEIVNCELCPRLRKHCREVARVKRRAYLDQTYWGKPVPGFGDPQARLIVIGLAPGAHGANRTGRVFTGDKSGDFLYRALHETGFASQEQSSAVDDGMILHDCFISASARCAPPDNKPLPEEIARCRPYLERELDWFRKARVVVCLGKVAFDNYLRILKDRGQIERIAEYPFAHGAVFDLQRNVRLIACYHPSQQNTSTGRLTAAMLRDVFDAARDILAPSPIANGLGAALPSDCPSASRTKR